MVNPSPGLEDDFLQGTNLLVAEDNELNAEIVTELLKSKGANVILAKNGRDSIENFR